MRYPFGEVSMLLLFLACFSPYRDDSAAYTLAEFAIDFAAESCADHAGCRRVDCERSTERRTMNGCHDFDPAAAIDCVDALAQEDVDACVWPPLAPPAICAEACGL
jgi:hypothetical protein